MRRSMTEREKYTLCSVVLLALLVALGWYFRLEFFEPFIYQRMPTSEDPIGKIIVVCQSNRWSGQVRCNSVSLDSERVDRELEKWLKEYPSEEKQDKRLEKERP